MCMQKNTIVGDFTVQSEPQEHNNVSCYINNNIPRFKNIFNQILKES